MRNKTTYDTSFIVAYSKGVRGRMYDNIPRSTKRDWRDRCHDHIYGFEQICSYVDLINTAEENKQFRQLLISLYRLFCLYRGILNTLPNKNQRLFEVRDRIIGSTQGWLKDFPINKVVQVLGISSQQYSWWKRDFYCRYSPVKFCRHVFSNQLTIKEVELIRQYVSSPQYKKWSLISIYYVLIRETVHFFSVKTFYKYVRLLDLRTKKKVRRKSVPGPRASKPLELLHMDITEYWISDNVRAYLHIIIDNYSRKILGLRIGKQKSSELAYENLLEVYEKYNLADQPGIMIMINDSGGENLGKTKSYIESLPNMQQHFTIRKRHDCSNNIIEALISKVKQCFIYSQEFTSFENFESTMIESVIIYNNKMPLAAINGRTPEEAFTGIMPFKPGLSELIQLSYYSRVSENRNSYCY